MADHLTVAVATPLSEELCLLIEAREPRCELIRDQSLLPPMRYPGDHAGDPGFRRTARQEEAFRAMLTHADASYGIPGESPQLLAWTAEHNPGLRWVHTTAAGGGAQVRQAGLSREQLDRITFTTSAGVHAAPLAEFAVFGVLAGAKLLPRLTAQKHDRTWGGAFLMRQLSQMTVLVAGMGHIGNRCIDDFHALGARVIAYNRSVHDNPNVSAVYTTGQLGEAVEQADAIVVTLPGTERTNKLLSAEILQQVRPGTILVNVGRGTVIDQAAMVNALADGRLAFAALDVVADEPLPTDSPLWGLPNVIISPHTAGLDAHEDRSIAELFARSATLILDGREPLNRVNTVEFY
ncbi:MULTISPECIES: D-2-hydroxyacid dehydrogenase [Propionibacterium]|uniref:D-2-hydroxyacid dehydrogenase n=1 Tax=Propionibacterium TaxID=1743 RepID=UPI0005426A81|nr:D-2-hydroxyacid dehydrogenase [Propionibacterium freudenreichii]MDN5961530.1 D-2-hydroxyacid dehydrogenase [Propionibacterium sp.]AJQ90010.1 D-isomer specific 2-hydroxyacid dehydrogenase NAD-binding protein [Propionibacterium freudenreichii subsp. freudenreichii]MCT2977067.1 D-2-hydroxyacid dehydrogenase [Propionibacterium freudenreichii]MCT2979973.1 D-2-hydroxyacid dehydrogenase [Propionibacterium freudenreichii]MCT2991958.1 D-2-hydroxyacid dehydrogenase [Propionibacterium freudenreichii]